MEINFLINRITDSDSLCYLQESGQADREGMTVAEMVQHGLPGNSQRNDTYADQLRHMAAPGCGGQKLTDSAVDR